MGQVAESVCLVRAAGGLSEPRQKQAAEKGRETQPVPAWHLLNIYCPLSLCDLSSHGVSRKNGLSQPHSSDGDTEAQCGWAEDAHGQCRESGSPSQSPHRFHSAGLSDVGMAH